MCGRLNITDNPFVSALLDDLKVVNPEHHKYNNFVGAASSISIIRENEGERKVEDATWWLLLEESENGGYKPSRYTSFNTRFDKLNKPGSAGYQAFKETRCVVIVTGFGETEITKTANNKSVKHYHNFYAVDGAIALAGLYRQWLNKNTGEITYSSSIITNPPHPKLIPYHKKASPMMLNQNDDSIDHWLNCSSNTTEQFTNFTQPKIYQDLSVVAIEKPSSPIPIGPAELIVHDLY